MLSRKSVLVAVIGALVLASACSKDKAPANEPAPGVPAPVPSVIENNTGNLDAKGKVTDVAESKEAPVEPAAPAGTDTAAVKTELEGTWQGVCEAGEMLQLSKYTVFGFTLPDLSLSQRQIIRIEGNEMFQTVSYFAGKACSGQGFEKQDENGFVIGKKFRMEIVGNFPANKDVKAIDLHDYAGDVTKNVFQIEKSGDDEVLYFGNTSVTDQEDLYEGRPMQLNRAIGYSRAK